MKTNNSILFCFLGNIFLQVFILNRFLFSNWINPYYYIIFILFLPIRKNYLFIILASFLIGFFVDIGIGTLSTSGPIHAFSSLCLGYFRPKYLKIISKKNTDFRLLKSFK